MKIGADDKRKVKLLIGLGVVALATVYVQFFSGPSSSAPASRSRPAVTPTSSLEPQTRAVRSAPKARPSARGRGQSFEPIWRRSHEDETFDPLQADPTLRTDLLAAVREVEFSGVERNIFRFTTRKVVVEAPPKQDVDEAQNRQAEFEAQAKAAAAKPAPATTPPPAQRAPRISWKYYGFASEAGAAHRRAFLLDGEEVLIGGEGDIFKKRYKIVRIGLSSIVIEDMDFKEEQTLPIAASQG